MHAVGVAGQRNVCATVDQELAGAGVVAHSPHRVPRQAFEFTQGKVFLAKLDVIHTGARRLGNLAQHGRALLGFCAAECLAIGYVVEQHCCT
jgi:hypothetical protein